MTLRQTQPSTGLRRYLTLLAFAISIAIFGSLILQSYQMARAYEQGLADRLAREISDSISRLAYADPSIWKYQVDRIESKVDQGVAGEEPGRRAWSVRVLTGTGEPVFEQLARPSLIWVSSKSPIRLGFEIIGHVEARNEIYGLHIILLQPAVLATLISIALFTVLYVVPFRALRLREVALQDAVTRAHESETRALTSADRLNRAVACLDKGLALFDSDRRLVLWNGPFVEILLDWNLAVREGLKLEELARQLATSNTSPDGEVADVAPLRDNSDRFAQFEAELVTPRGRVATLSQFGTEFGETLVALRDVSRQHELEARNRQAQKMEAVGQLTGGIAHDFNNMLAAILGNLEMLGDHLKGNASARRSLDIASRAASRAAELTHRLLAFSRQQHLEPQAIDLREALRGIHGLLQTTLTEAVEMEMQISEDLRQIWADPAQLESAILNLAINARDAMPEGGRLVIESTNADLDEDYAGEHDEVVPGSYVMLTVSDNGRGMPSDVRERAFEPFFTTKEVGEGTGLGLSTIYGFVKQLGGHVTLYSEEGHGTCVKLYLPVAAASQTASPETSASRDDYPGGAETVLVVEDDADVSETALVLLEHLGYRVLLAENGPAALRLLEEHRDIDLLFTDVVMPGGMSGLDLAREVSCRIPNLKVLCTSGYSERALVKDGNVPWEIEWIGKPYLHRALAMKVRQVLDKPQA